MSNHTGVSPKDPNKYLGPNVFLTLCVTRNRSPTSADYRQPETGKLYPFSSLWLVGKDPTTGTQGDLWYLSKIVANVAFWLKLSSGAVGPLINIQVQQATAPGVNPVTPTVAGLVNINGAAVANHSVPIETRTRALNTFNVEVQYGTTSATTDATKSGLIHAFSGQFSLDANGFLQLVGGSAPSLQKINVDANTAPGTDPVVPDGSGQITLTGAQVAAGIVGANVIRSNSLAVNSITMEIQRSIAVASTASVNNGVSHFSSAQFAVDANGFVQLLGSTTNSMKKVVRQVFTSSGTYTPTTNMLYADVEVVGGGGGSGGCATTGMGEISAAGSGGGGGYARKIFTAATIGVSQTVTVGAGGLAGTAGNNNGGTGGTSSLGALISATGGTGGMGAANGATNQSSGGTGGSGSSGDFNTTGTPAFISSWDSGKYVWTSPGGSSFFGGGAPGNNGTLPAAAIAGTSYGGGASGGQIGNSTSAIAGAAGFAGVVIITEYVG